MMTSSLAGERPPLALLILNPASSNCPRTFSCTEVDIWSACFFFSSPKEANVNWNLLTLWDISSLRKSRWMTGTPVGPLLGPVIAPLPVGEWAETWKGSSGAGGAFLANWVSHESFEGSRALLAGAERRQKTDFIFPTALSSTEYFPLLLYLSSNR